MNTYKYRTTDNRTVFSDKPLHYALIAGNEIDLRKLSAEDFSLLTIVADEHTAAIIDAACTQPKKQNATQNNQSNSTYSWYLHNYCLLSGNVLQIKDGNTYKPLTSFLKTASEEDLKYVLTQVAMQAAMCRGELLERGCEMVAG